MAADQYDVILISVTNHIEIMKAIMAVNLVGLKRSKEMADKPPAIVLTKVSQSKAQQAKKALEDAGGTVEIRPS